MRRFQIDGLTLIFSLILPLILFGCTRARPDPSTGVDQDSPLLESLPSSEEEGQPTTIAIQPTATQITSAVGSNGSIGEDNTNTTQTTNTPITSQPTNPAPTATPITSVPNPNGGTSGQILTHIVQPGENLFRISKRYSVSLNDIAQLNGITNPDYVYVGQRIKIPGQYSPGGGNIYIVQRGDTLNSIASRHSTTLQALLKANNLTNPDYIYVGQRLKIP